tara:strand:- start:5451 stop:6794 length:1344 start_codon:yes stop_codon:yes gene_type:complete
MSILTKEGSVLDIRGSSAISLDVDELLEKIRNDLHEPQREFFDNSNTEILGLSAGYGAGKTRALCAVCVKLAALNVGFTGAVMEPTGPLIRDIWQADFEQFLEYYEIPYTFRASPLPEYVLHLPKGDTKILCRSFENWSRIIGLNLAFVLADEIDTVAPSVCDRAFPKILGRLRSGNVRQFCAASTPEGFRWMWNTFGSEAAQEREDRKLIRMRTQDNPHLPDDFIERMQANYDPSMLQAYLNGEFVNLTTGQVYDRFTREKNVITAKPDIGLDPIRVGIDFNIGNMNAVIGVVQDQKLLIFDEISGSHDTDSIAQEIKSRYPMNKIYVYPDASGGNRSTNASQTDIQILEGYGFSNQSPRSNPPVRDRISSVQALLCNGKGESRFQIHASCRKLIESMELQSYTEKGEPDKESGYDHMADAVGYLIWREFNPLFARAGRPTGIRIY